VIPVTPLRSAQKDIRRAARFYEDEARGLGGEFVTEIERAFARLAENPEIGPPASALAQTKISRYNCMTLYYMGGARESRCNDPLG
jgi:plasmid stabilization system protein ParE